MKKLPPKLYHYCSVESMFNIIKSKSLWLSNSGQMNDSEESTWIEQYFPSLKDLFVSENETQFLNDAIKLFHQENNKPFIFCFSERKDSLSQWRAYSSDGRGVCLGFSTNKLSIKRIPSTLISLNRTLLLLPITYNSKQQKSKLSELSENYKRKIKSDKEIFIPFIIRMYQNRLLALSLVFKNHSFSEEKEWRIIQSPLTEESSSKSEIDNRISKLQFRVSGDKLFSYCEFHLKEIFNSKLIPEIVLGPKSKIDIPELELFLKANGLEGTKVIRSESTYR